MSPLEKQYNEIIRRYPGVVLLFQQDDYILTMKESAHAIHKALDTPLAKATAGHDITGFPSIELERQLPKLVKAGNRVGIVKLLKTRINHGKD